MPIGPSDRMCRASSLNEFAFGSLIEAGSLAQACIARGPQASDGDEVSFPRVCICGLRSCKYLGTCTSCGLCW